MCGQQAFARGPCTLPGVKAALNLRSTFTNSVFVSRLHTRKRASFVFRKTQRRLSIPTCTARAEAVTTKASSNVPLFSAASAACAFRKDIARAVREAVTKASHSLSRAQASVSLAIIFVHTTAEAIAGDDMRRVVPEVRRALAFSRVLSEHTCITGCTSGVFGGVAAEGNGDENEMVSVALLHLPESLGFFHAFRIDHDAVLQLDGAQEQWWKLVRLEACMNDRRTSPPPPQFLLLQHPEYGSMSDLLSGLDFAFPQSVKVGAVASRVNALHEAYVFDNFGAHRNGVTGIALITDALRIDAMLAQGARGVGPMLQVTEVRSKTEIVRAREIATSTQAEAAPMQLLDMWDHTDVISESDRQYARKYLLMGLEVHALADVQGNLQEESATEGVEEAQQQQEQQERTKSKLTQEPDMVVRKVLGFNELTRSVAVEGSAVRLGTRMRFQVRDERAAREELGVIFDRQALEAVNHSMEGRSLIGGLVLADVERGENLYGDVACDTDRRLFKDRFNVPTCTLACQGQIAPLPAPGFKKHFPIRGVGVAASTFTHSPSALYVLFYARMTEQNDDGDAKDEPKSTT